MMMMTTAVPILTMMRTITAIVTIIIHMYAVKKDDVENKARGIDAFGVGLGYNVLTLLTYYYNICTKAHSSRHMLNQQENRI